MNGYGTGDYSDTVSILAAQRPDTPTAPTTEIYEQYSIKISWVEPFTGGSPITSYLIKIRMVDGISYQEETANCDGSDPTILSQRFCLVPVATVKNLPYELEWNTGVYANVQAFNEYGNSATSLTGNGAIITTTPDYPVNLANDPTLTTAT